MQTLKMRNDGYAAYESMILSGNFTRGITGLEMNFVAKKGIVCFSFVGTQIHGRRAVDRSGGMNSRRYCRNF
jgi:hypothetical protein